MQSEGSFAEQRVHISSQEVDTALSIEIVK